MTLLEAVKRARKRFDKIAYCKDGDEREQICMDAIAELRQVIAEAEDQEPEAWMQVSTGVIRTDWGFDKTGYVPLYTHPLTFDEQEMLRLCPHFGPSPARDEWIAGYKAARGNKEKNHG